MTTRRITTAFSFVLAAILFAIAMPNRATGQATATQEATAASPVVYTLPDTTITSVEPNVTNDRKLLLGGIGSDLWHGAGDKANEFWMITDRGPNGQIKVDDKNR